MSATEGIEPSTLSVGKALDADIPSSGGAALWIRAQVGNHKVANPLFGSRIGQCIVVPLGKTLTTNIPIMGPSNLPVVMTHSD